ncbi:DUF6221 family protein [Streptomyces sp. NPDC002308]
MNDLVVFLRARLDEREAVARAAGEQRGGPVWAAHDNEDWPSTVTGMTRTGVVVDIVEPNDIETVAHIAANDPASVLREVEATRAAVDQCAYWNERAAREATDPPKYPQPGLDIGLLLDALNPALRALALPYADHPDYQETWRP